MIALSLGHVSIETTQTYVHALAACLPGRAVVVHTLCRLALERCPLAGSQLRRRDGPPPKLGIVRRSAQSAKANHREPYAYLRQVFTELPKATTLAKVEALLPWNVARPVAPPPDQQLVKRRTASFTPTFTQGLLRGCGEFLRNIGGGNSLRLFIEDQALDGVSYAATVEDVGDIGEPAPPGCARGTATAPTGCGP